MPFVYVGIGSNIVPDQQLQHAFVFFDTHFTSPVFSSIYRSHAVGFDGADFYNAVVGFEYDNSIVTLLAMLSQQEKKQCKQPLQRFCDRHLDLDLLLYDDTICYRRDLELPRSDIVKYPFVLAPLAEVAPDKVHPLLGLSYQTLWDGFNPSLKQTVARVESALMKI